MIKGIIYVGNIENINTHIQYIVYIIYMFLELVLIFLTGLNFMNIIKQKKDRQLIGLSFYINKKIYYPKINVKINISVISNVNYQYRNS